MRIKHIIILFVGISLGFLAKFPLKCEDVFYFEAPTPVFPITKLTIIQVLSGGDAIARAEFSEFPPGFHIVAIRKNNAMPFYHHQVIVVSHSQIVKHVGSYIYGDSHHGKIIPIVDFFDK